MRLETAAITSLFAGYLLLPSGLSIDLPLLPPIDKSSVTVLSTLLLCLARAGAPRRGSVGMLIHILMAAYVLAPVAATFGNSYELRIGSLSIPGFYLLDGLKGGINNLIQVSAFWIGSRFLSSPTGRLVILKVLLASMLAYSLPLLFEVRFSPQLQRMVYGNIARNFIDQVRWGGYRPAVFLPQGLQLALFVAMALVAACILARTKTKVLRLPAGAAAAYLAPILILCKTLGAVVYAVAAAPLAMFCRPSTCVKVAMVLTIFVCGYPALRTQQLVPVETVFSLAGVISKDRANSFGVRLTNESLLMAKANQKPLFGWGGWGRNRIYNADYAKDVTITDGGWIIYFGLFGWFGYLALFGLFAVSVVRLNGAIKTAEPVDAIVSGGIALILAINIADMLPNANLTPLTFVLAGSIARKVAATRKRRPMTENATHAPETRSPAVEMAFSEPRSQV